MTVFDKQYLDVMENILEEGFEKGDRTKTGTVSTFGQMIKVDIRDGRLPLLTTKKMFFNSFIHETLWFLSGSTDIKYLKDNNISIWDSWVDPKTAVYRDLTDQERRQALVKAEIFQSEEEVPDAEDIQETLLAVNEIPLKKLVSGDIGKGAYGAMWRNMEDTRLIKPSELEECEKKGFKLKGYLGDVKLDVLGNVTEDKREAVVTRNIDQLVEMIRKLKEDPDNRRNITHLYDSRMVDFCQLAPCHSLHMAWTRELSVNERLKIARERDIEIENIPLWGSFLTSYHYQLDSYGIPKRALRLMLWARSQDYPVGTPFNIAQYALLAHMLAHVTNMVAEELVWVGADTHIYSNQVELVREQLDRQSTDSQARVYFKRTIDDIDDFKFEDIVVTDYDNYHPAIKYPVAV